MRFIKTIGIIAGTLYLLIHLLMYFLQDKILFHPTLLQDDHPFAFREEFEEIQLATPDGSSINALHFKLPDPKGLILHFHGNGGSLEEVSDLRNDFLSKGWEVMFVDYRGYGKSRGKISQKGLLEDVKTAATYVSTKIAPKKFVLYGQSLGSGPTTWLASEVLHDGIILETPYYSLKRSARENYPWLLTGLLLKFPMPSNEWLPKSTTPVLIVHGTEDETIPLQHPKDLQALAPDRIKLVTIEGGMHNDLRNFQKYHQALTDFLENL